MPAPEQPPSPQHLAAALAAVGEAVEIVGLTGQIEYVNPAWERVTGFSAAEAIGRTPRELLRSDLHAGGPEAVDELAAGRPWRGLLVAHKKDGERFEAEIVVSPVRDDAGRVYAFVAIRRDRTAERRQVRLLTESEERYKLAALGAKDGLWDWQLGERDMYVSPRWLWLFGEQAEAGRRVKVRWFLDQIHPSDRKRVGEEFDAHVKGATAHFVTECRVRHESLGWRWVECRGLAFRDEQGRPVRMAGSLTDITERKSEQRMLFLAATHDPLTGLPNRGLFVDRVTHAITRCGRNPSARFALVFIDLRGFKQVNDGLGHGVGDALLTAVARRLTTRVRAGDTVSRLGGDEFGVILEGVGTEREADGAARRIEESLRRPFEVEGHTIHISGTLGVVLGGASSDVDTLIRDADGAMYQARRNGDAGHHLIDEGGRADAARRMRLGADLAEAITTRALRMVYQPIFAIADGRMVGAEALCRWSHPELGAIGPAEFVPIAEDAGISGLLGIATIDLAIQQLDAWRAQAVLPPGFVLNLNLSGRQIADPRLVARLEAAHAAGAFRPGELCVEVVEAALMERPGRVAEVLERLALAGVLVAIDNFGTGNSSLAHLRRLHLHALKIDRSLVGSVVDDPVTCAMVAAVVNMARALKIGTVAEGVETRQQLSALRAAGCDHAQGYLLARPVRPEAMPFAAVPQPLAA